MRLMSLSMLLLLPSLGCSSLATPSAVSGTTNYQQLRADRFDPYPEPDIGPEMVGVRPRDFEKPKDEVRRARWNPLGWMQGFRRGF